MFKVFLFWVFVTMIISVAVTILSSLVLTARKEDTTDVIATIAAYVGMVSAIITGVSFCIFMIGAVKLFLGV